MDFPPYSLQAAQTQKVIVTSIISQILEEVEIMSKFIFPLQMSATDGKYHNYFGEFNEDSLIKDGSYEFGISECRSGLFHLEGL